MSQPQRGLIRTLQAYSLPLLGGVAAAMLAANLTPEWYEHAVHWRPFGDVALLGHALTLHFIVNDLFMVLFFGIAAKEITESCLPGGTLNPPAKAINPLLATAGGVIGPVAVFFAGLWIVYTPELGEWAALERGWGVPTATDIALAWLVARAVFGTGHPAIDFLLLLAVADDAVGLIIIAIFYGDPAHPARPEFLLLVVAGMAVAYALRRANVRSWLPYIGIGGPLAWCGLILAHLHPALALVFIVPFLPGPQRDLGLFREIATDGETTTEAPDHSPLHQFEHQLKTFVDFGLFFFAFTQAGVVLAQIGTMTWLILAALVIGKTVGITSFGLLGRRLGFPLPDGMGVRDLVMAAYVAALGLTVALFVATAAFTDPVLLGQGKMGALFSAFVGLSAVLVSRALGFGRPADPGAPAGAGDPEATAHRATGGSRAERATSD